MTIWIDAQLSPSLARWISRHFEDLEAIAVRDLGLRDAEDKDIFEAARAARAIVMSKDGDFATMIERFGPPPQVIWVRTGNTSKAAMRKILSAKLGEVLGFLRAGEPLVEIV